MRYKEFSLVESKVYNKFLLTEGARIDHAEDVIFWEGSVGAIRILNALKSLEEGGHQDVTIKWDGSPAIIFGRNENGEFILTDKSGFGAKGYDGKAKSGKDLEAMFMARPGAQKDPEGYGQLAANMRDIFDKYQTALPQDFRGFLKGDLLYFNTPEVQNGKYIFTPNIVTYEVDVNSELGKKIGQSKSGIVVHRLVDENDNESELPNGFQMQGTEVLLFPSVTVQKAAQLEDEDINQLKSTVSKNAAGIDAMLNVGTLEQLKMKDLTKIFYAYVNSKVDTGLENLGSDFLNWLKGSKVSAVKQQRIAEYIGQHKQAFDAMWKIVSGIMEIKNKIINQFDSHDAEVKASIGDHGPVTPDAHGSGGEGYVLAHPEGDIKLVPRAYFTKANRSVQR